MYGNYVRVNES